MGLAKRPDASETVAEPKNRPENGSGVDCTTSFLADCRVGGRNGAKPNRCARSVAFGEVQKEETATSRETRLGLQSARPHPAVDNRIPALWGAVEGSFMSHQHSGPTGPTSPTRMRSSKRLKSPKKPASEKIAPVAKSKEPATDFEIPGGTLDMAHFLKTTGPPAPADVKAARRKQRIPSPIYFLRHRKDQDQTASESLKSRLSHPPESVEQKISQAGTKYLHIVTENPDDEP
jgi:hypothetical protein